MKENKKIEVLGIEFEEHEVEVRTIARNEQYRCRKYSDNTWDKREFFEDGEIKRCEDSEGNKIITERGLNKITTTYYKFDKIEEKVTKEFFYNKGVCVWEKVKYLDDKTVEIEMRLYVIDGMLKVGDYYIPSSHQSFGGIYNAIFPKESKRYDKED